MPPAAVEPPAPALVHSPAATYARRAADFGRDLARLERRARLNGNLNLLFFFAAGAALTAGAVREETAWYWLAGGLAVAFIAGLAALQTTKQAAAHAAALVALNQEGLARLARNWAGLPAPKEQAGQALPAVRPPGASPIASQPAQKQPTTATSPATSPATSQATSHATSQAIDPATAADLDLLGPGSLQHLLNTAATPIGQATLRAWLLQPAAPAVARQRQAAARELAPLVDLRDALAARGRQMGGAQEHYERLVAWAEAPRWLARLPLLLWAARLLPLLALLLALAIWQRWPLLAALPLYGLLGGLLLLILGLALTAGNRAAATIAEVEAEQQVFATYADLFDLLSRQTFTAPALQRLHAALGTQPASGAASGAATGAATGDPHARTAVQEMARLQRLMPLASIRRWLLFLPVEWFTLWNIHLLWLLERWQAEAGPQVRRWLAALGEFEALGALATLHHDHPAWCFAQFDEEDPAGGAHIRATGLAHPLLPPAAAVGNDVALGPPGSFLLVTGSNMSGKSTLLRALGLNCVLAQMGAPACAAALVLPPVRVVSSMRVQDSLTSGVSYFLAELQSLKAIVDLAEAPFLTGAAGSQAERSARVVYLLDEILQGTNSAERQIAARHIIQRLVHSGAIGAVSTHDLALAAAPEVAVAATAFHFTESFTPAQPGVNGGQGPAMSFDYTLRPGIATSTNALKLMQVIGLYGPEESPPPPQAGGTA